MSSKTVRYSRKRVIKKQYPSNSKFYELVVLFARLSEGDPKFGALKLNKLLFNADFMAYLRFGKSITGQEYFALPNGPAPKLRTAHWDQMIKRGDIAVRVDPGTKREVTLALREPDVTKFDQKELALVYSLVKTYRRKLGREMSEESHRFHGWALAKEKETIPYTVALVGRRKPNADEVKRGLALQSSATACLAQYAA